MYPSMQSILITGGTGSFGKAFVKQILEKSEKLEQLRTLENDLSIHVLEVDEYDAWGIDTPEDLEKFRTHIEKIES